MKVGDEKRVKVAAKDAYGTVNPNAIQEVPKEKVPSNGLKVGAVLMAGGPNGQSVPVTVKEIKEKTVVIDMNHPMAGKNLVFDIKILDVQPAAAATAQPAPPAQARKAAPAQISFAADPCVLTSWQRGSDHRNKSSFLPAPESALNPACRIFRSPGGVWARYQPVYFDEFMASEAARIRHWKLKKETYELYKRVEPNIGHFAIRNFETRGQLLGLITQNIDGLHRLAGVSDDKIVELHGSDRLVTCLGCGKRFEPFEIYENLPEEFDAPKCDACGGFLKSANVSFGQQMPAEAMRRAQAWSEGAEVFIVIGSSLQVQPAASFPVIAHESGSLLAIINRDETPLDDLADFIHRGPIGAFFEQLNPLLADA